MVGVGWGAFWTPRPAFLRDQWTEITPLLADGRLQPLLGERWPLEQAAEGLHAIAERRATGNLMLDVR